VCSTENVEAGFNGEMGLIGNVIHSINTLRLCTFLRNVLNMENQGSEGVIHCSGVLGKFLIAHCKDLIFSQSEDNEKDKLDLLRTVCGALTTISIVFDLYKDQIPNASQEFSQIFQTFF
jgi:hypothetical protein